MSLESINPLNSVIDKAGDIIGKLVVDKDAANAAKHELDVLRITTENEQLKMQAQANIESAKHSSIFVAGARPACIWALLACIVWSKFGHPLTLLLVGIFAPGIDISALPPPADDLTDVFILLGGLLGLVTARSFEKIKGVARNSL